jgi:ABC-type multidrug transport system ATPase subunit
MIRFQDVSFRYEKGESILTDIHLDFPPGLTMLLGPNGCGKSTLLKLAAGVEKPDSGAITIDGADLWKNEIEARRNLAFVSEQPDLTPYATLKEIMNLVCRLRHEPLKKGREVLEFFDLGTLTSRTVRELSLGQRRRAVFAAAFIGEPQHILLDEPLEGMDRRIQQEILDWIQRRLSADAVLVIVSHTVEPFVSSLSRAVTIKEGRAVLFEDLPPVPEDRLKLLDSIAKGIIPS